MTTLEFPTRAPAGPKLVVVLPAVDEQETIGRVVAAVPRRIAGIATVEVILVDDGSTDATAERALAAGVDAVARHTRNRGLVAAFNRGVREALAAGADVVVTLDSDGQHDPTAIPRVVAPIVAGTADIVVGVRPLHLETQGSAARRHGNRLGSAVMRHTLGVPISDFTSGFRAFSREALLQLNVVSDFTYTLETLIQASRKRLAITEVVVPALAREVGESRMTRSIVRYVKRTGGQAFLSMLHGRPLVAFGRVGAAAAALAGGFLCWFLYGYQDGGMHLPSLLAALLFMLLSGGLFLGGLIADGTNANRRLLEDALYRIKLLEAGLDPPRLAEHDDAAALPGRATAQGRPARWSR